MITAGGNCLQDIFFLPEKHRNETKNKSRMHILPSLSYMLHIQYAAFIFDSSFIFFFYHSASPFDF